MSAATFPTVIGLEQPRIASLEAATALLANLRLFVAQSAHEYGSDTSDRYLMKSTHCDQRLNRDGEQVGGRHEPENRCHSGTASRDDAPDILG